MAKKSVLDDLLDLLFEITGMFWQVGAVITTIMVLLSAHSLFWVFATMETPNSSPVIAGVLDAFSWLLYALPIGLALMAFIFGRKSYQVYHEQSRTR
ncbi:MAG: hypothetical protein ABW153_12265 [Sedimenticola sp.]